MPSISATVKPTLVPRCPTREAGCEDCQRRWRYERSLAIWERENGIERSYAPVAETKAHLDYLLAEGNRTIPDLAVESGISDAAIRAIVAGRRQRLYQLTVKSLLAMKPVIKAKPSPRTSYQVPSTEGVRLLRGLFAQGWSFPTISDLLGGLSAGAAQKIANYGHQQMNRQTLDRIRAVVRELGRYDIEQLDKPMAGMDIRCAHQATKKGWHKLAAWRFLDIADPDADPDAPADLADLAGDLVAVEHDDDLDDLDDAALAFVDQLLIKQVTEVGERIKLESPDATGTAGDLYIPKFEALRWLELHAVWWHAEAAGLNDTQIGALLGYDMSDQKSKTFDAGQRQVNRIRARMIEAVAMLDKHPRDWMPAWFNEDPKPIGKPNFGSLLPALLAIQPAPLGRGWTAGWIADEIGATEREVHDFLVYASREGERLWHRRTGPPKRVRNRGARCATATTVAA